MFHRIVKIIYTGAFPMKIPNSNACTNSLLTEKLTLRYFYKISKILPDILYGYNYLRVITLMELIMHKTTSIKIFQLSANCTNVII